VSEWDQWLREGSGKERKQKEKKEDKKITKRRNNRRVAGTIAPTTTVPMHLFSFIARGG
jgi:hypothetical protein